MNKNFNTKIGNIYNKHYKPKRVGACKECKFIFTKGMTCTVCGFNKMKTNDGRRGKSVGGWN